MPQTLTDQEFEDKIKQSNRPVIVDFWAEWCGPCRQLAPTLEAVAADFADDVDIYKMNIDENPETPTAMGVRGIPTLIMFKDGKAYATKSGNLPKTTLSEWIKENIS